VEVLLQVGAASDRSAITIEIARMICDPTDLLWREPDVERVQEGAHTRNGEYASKCSWLFRMNVA
jgi:hypothetical protein